MIVYVIGTSRDYFVSIFVERTPTSVDKLPSIFEIIEKSAVFNVLEIEQLLASLEIKIMIYSNR